MATLSDAALNIISQKPRFWQHKLFAQVLEDEISKAKEIRKDHKKGKPSFPKFTIPESEFRKWIASESNAQGDRIERIYKSCNILAGLAFGDKGTDKDITFMVDLAEELGKGYRELIEGSQNFRSASLPIMYAPFLKEAALHAENYISQIESLPSRLLIQLKPIESDPGNGPFNIDLTIDMEAHNSEAFEREWSTLKVKYDRRFPTP